MKNKSKENRESRVRGRKRKPRGLSNEKSKKLKLGSERKRIRLSVKGLESVVRL